MHWSGVWCCIGGSSCNVLGAGAVGGEVICGDVHPVLHGFEIFSGCLNVVDVIQECDKKTGLVGWYACASGWLVRSSWRVVFKRHEYFLTDHSEEIDGCITVAVQGADDGAVWVEFDDVLDNVRPDTFSLAAGDCHTVESLSCNLFCGSELSCNLSCGSSRDVLLIVNCVVCSGGDWGCKYQSEVRCSVAGP